MYLSRVVVKNYRNLKSIDVTLNSAVNCVVGENNSGKSNFLHAVRLCLDMNLPSSLRSLTPVDINSDIDQTKPFHVLIGVEFSGYSKNLSELALLHSCQIGNDRARIFFRYRPKKVIRDAIAAKERQTDGLQPEDYGWDLLGGGNPCVDLQDIEWKDEVGEPVRFSDLQYFQVVTLPALRDVEYDLRNGRLSPLVKLLDATDIPQADRDAFIKALVAANGSISSSKPLAEAAKSIGSTFATATGPSYQIGIGIGIGDPTYQSILRSLRVLLSENGAPQDIDPSRNGLGLNNVLYISLWLEYLSKRIKRADSAGQVLLIEEPEAHLHPQLQMTLMGALERLSLQSLVTTHSTHVTARMPISSCIILTKTRKSILSHTLSSNDLIEKIEREDLQRYLDATKSTLLFARKVLLVEGPSELILIPPLVKEMSEIDLEHHGISVISVSGTHFGPFAKLFSDGRLGKRCAIIGDADLSPPVSEDDDDIVIEPRSALVALESKTLRVFLGRTTFEREVAEIENAKMIIAAVASSGLKKASERLRDIAERAVAVGPSHPNRFALEEDFRNFTLRAAIRIGKARFAQRCASEVTQSFVLPQYIADAIDWLIQE